MSKTCLNDRTMQSHWRKAVLKANRNRCAVCGIIRADGELECHHLVKRRYRILRHDYRNGVPVCIMGCHRYADTTTGTAEILKKHKYEEYLTGIVRKYQTVKEYLIDYGITQLEKDRADLDELKTISTWSKT